MKAQQHAAPKSVINKQTIALGVLLVLMAVAFFSGWLERLDLAFVQENRDALQAFVLERPIVGVGLFVLTYTLCVALSLPIATLLTLLGGFLFGVWLGLFAVVIGATLGATILFLIARSSLGDPLRQKAGPMYQKVATHMNDNAVGYLFFMRLVPIFPFFLVNIVPAFFGMSVLSYVVVTFFGILPGTFVFVNFGQQLGSIGSVGDLVSPSMLFALALLGVFALIPTVYRYFKPKVEVV